MDNPIIHIANLRRDFVVGAETVRALKGVSFQVHTGEFITIMGASGSGKTTLLNILGCLDQPTGGDYVLDGASIKKMGPDERARLRNRKIGFVFQSYNLLPRTSALENVELPLLYNSALRPNTRRERAAAALDRVGLLFRIDHTPSQLSGGQQQRVAIARALVNDPVLILADEATGNLDTRTSYGIMALFQELNRQGVTIVFITHETDIAAFSRRTIRLRDGRIVSDAPVAAPAQADFLLAQLPTDPNEEAA
jgi:putative ABC transport system ATP-binding protein